MKFSTLDLSDYAGIAQMERKRRWHETGKAGWPAERRSAADDDWAAISEFEFDLVEITPLAEQSDTPERRERQRLAEMTMRVAIAAVRRHRDQGYPSGEPEQHAYRLLKLARRMAQCTGQPYPCLGSILAQNLQEKAA